MTKEEIELCNIPAIQDRRGEWQDGDRYYECDPDYAAGGTERIVDVHHSPEHSKHKVIWLPLPIDPVNPERGLWGMVDWPYTLSFIDFAGKIEINRFAGKNRGRIVGTPTEALLRAIHAQVRGE